MRSKLPKTLFPALAACLLILGTAAGAETVDQTTHELTVDQIIAKNLETRGGVEAVKAVASARLRGKMSVGPGMEAPFTLDFKRPQKVRMEFEIQGMTGVQAYDGEQGWGIMPFMGKTEPEVLAGDELKAIEEMADFDGPLVDYADKGHAVELLGIENVDGTDAYKLKITKKNGDVQYSFLDTEYFLEFRQEGRREVQGTELNIISEIGDYKEVGDVLLAHSIQSSPEGVEFTQTITIESVDLGVEVDDELFAMPAAKTEAETGNKPSDG